MPEPTTVKVTADLSQMKQEFAAGTAEFNRWAQNINAGNTTAMKSFRATGEELRQLGVAARVSSAEMDKLNTTISRVETAAATAGNRTATAFERGARGLSVMARQGDVTARSMNQIIAAGSDIAFSFGSEGAIISAVLMVTAGIVSNLESTESKMEATVRSFNMKVADILMNDSPVEAARAAGRAYVQELRALGQIKSDSATVAAAAAKAGDIWGNISALPAWWRLHHGDQNALSTAASNVDSARMSERMLKQVHAHDKQIEQLKGDERQAAQERAHWQEQVDRLRADGKVAELRVAQATLRQMQADVTAKRATITQLENDRDATARQLAASLSDKTDPDGTMRYALTHPDADHRAHTDFSDEDRRSDVAVSSRAAESRIQQLQRTEATRKRLDAERIREEQRANTLLIQIQDSAAQHEALADGQREAAEKARAQRDYDRRLTEIQSLSVTEAMKTRLLVAAARERDAAIAAVERTAYDRQQHALLHAMVQRLREVDKANAAHVRAEQRKEQILANVLASSGEALVRGHADLAHRIMQAALEPEVKYLEAMAMKHYALAAKDAATQNWVGAAEQIAGATALMAGAALVGSIAGTGGGAGGGGAGGGGGGGMSSASHLGAGGSATTQPLAVHVIIVHQDATGREISRTRQQFQRLDDRNVPVRVGSLG